MRRTAVVATSVAAVLGWAAVPASASQPMTAAGTFSILTDNFTPIRSADRNAFALESATLTYAGDLIGPASDTDIAVTYKDGSFRAHGTEICTGCTIAGSAPGNFTAVFTYAGAPTATGFEYSGHLTFTSGSGGLAGLHGQGTFAGNELGNTYSYNYSFGP